MTASSSQTDLQQWLFETRRGSGAESPGLRSWCGPISLRTHFGIALGLLFLSIYSDIYRPFGGSWSILYLIPIVYAASTLRGQPEYLIYLSTLVASYATPYLQGPQAFWSSQSPHTRTMGVLIGVIAGGLIRERRRYIGALQKANSELEERVALRTAELQRLNESLQVEILEREKSAANEQRLEMELRQAQKLEAIGALAGGVAHDFNNLLTVINGYCNLIIDQMPESTPMRQSMDEILKAGERAADLTRQLLAFGRKQVFQPTLVEVNQALTRSEELIRRLVHESIRVVFDLSQDPCPIIADEGQLIQILLNLASNAQDAMPRSGELRISTSHVEIDADQEGKLTGLVPGPHILMSISDSGEGMDEETQQHLFEPFFTTKNPGKGTGLGLASVYGIVKRTGGHIEVNSSPETGSRFDIYFPIAPQGSLSKPSKSRPKSAARRCLETILLVEDNKPVRLFVGGILRQAGYQVLEAGDGNEALALALQHRSEPIDLLLSDVVMPELGGPALVEQLVEKFQDLKVLYVSGYSDTDIARTTNIQVNFLPKPFSRTDLLKKIEEILTCSNSITLLAE